VKAFDEGHFQCVGRFLAWPGEVRSVSASFRIPWGSVAL
jgi:hypothetical protein